MLNDILANPDVQEAIKIVKNEFALAIWETIYVTMISTAFIMANGAAAMGRDVTIFFARQRRFR